MQMIIVHHVLADLLLLILYNYKSLVLDFTQNLIFNIRKSNHVSLFSSKGFNSMVGGVMGFSILISAEVFKHHPNVWYLDGTIGVLIGLIILAYGIK